MTEASQAPGRSERWPDLAGRAEAGRHVLPVRVYFEDTDFSGLVYHASYVRWMERGRSDWLRLLGVHHGELMGEEAAAGSAAFVVRRLEIDYLKPARIDDVLEVETACLEKTAATLLLEQIVRCGNIILCRGRVLVVLVSSRGRPLRLPERLRVRLGGVG